MKDYLEGDTSFAADLKDVLERPALGSGDLSNLSLAAFLHGMIGNASGKKQQLLSQLLDAARQLGIDDEALGDLAGGGKDGPEG